MNDPQKFHPSAGIAIGPILFVIALLAVLAAAMSSGGGDFQVASGADRITADVVAQANMIRNTINNCNMDYTLKVSMNAVAATSDPYPATPGSGFVTDLVCTPTDASSLWGAILLPRPTQGFSAWSYINAGATGGRCIWTTPAASSQSVVVGLRRAASKFNSSTAYSATTEVIYDPASASQKFIVWITPPTGTVDSHCLP